MKNMFQTKTVQKIKTHILCPINFFFENRAVYEIKWKNNVDWDRPQMTIWRLRIAWWITKATNTHSQYVMFIAFPLQQWLQEHASVLRFSTLAVLLLAVSVKISIHQLMGNFLFHCMLWHSGRSFGFVLAGVDISVTK
jgi:hypothetical protein